MIKRLLPAGLVLLLLLVATLGVAAPPERCPPVTAEQLRQSAQAGVDWFIRNQQPEGYWLYSYRRGDDAVVPEYNLVRHTGAVMGLYRAALEGLPRALPSADRGTQWALDRLLRRDGWSAVSSDGQVPTGATALLAAGLVLRREATGETRYDEVLRSLGRFLVAQTEPSGAVPEAYDPVAGAPVAGVYSAYFTGEAYWALKLLHRTFPDEGWGEVADRIGTYLVTQRDDLEDHWPDLPDHWAAYGLAETVRERPLTAAEARYARRQAELFGLSVRWVSQRFAPWGALVRGPDVLRGGGYGVISEAVTGLWLTAQADPRLADLREPLAQRAACIAGLAVRAQSDVAESQRFARPDRVAGASFESGETRMDDQQHALAGLLRTIAIVGAQADPDPDGDAPSGWLWLVALLLALNPARAAFAVPRAGRSRRAVAELAAAGGAIGGLVVCAVAALAGPLLDALDVSDPSFRAAAGIVALLAGAVDLFRRPPSPEPGLEDRWAALVPVAIPVVARPALVVMALGAGADHGLLVPVAAMVIGTGLLAALVAYRPQDAAGDRALRWAGRLLAAGLVACGVLLTLDGIFAV